MRGVSKIICIHTGIGPFSLFLYYTSGCNVHLRGVATGGLRRCWNVMFGEPSSCSCASTTARFRVLQLDLLLPSTSSYFDTASHL